MLSRIFVKNAKREFPIFPHCDGQPQVHVRHQPHGQQKSLFVVSPIANVNCVFTKLLQQKDTVKCVSRFFLQKKMFILFANFGLRNVLILKKYISLKSVCFLGLLSSLSLLKVLLPLWHHQYAKNGEIADFKLFHILQIFPYYSEFENANKQLWKL